MSELKAIRSEEIYDIIEYEDCYRTDDLYYLKSEADKVIAEKDEKIDELEERIDELQIATDSAWSKVNAMYDELSHQKYKRCLAMAWWCGDACDKWMMRKAKAIVLGKDGVEEYYRARRKLFHYMRWQNRWMKFAKKFKEA